MSKQAHPFNPGEAPVQTGRRPPYDHDMKPAVKKIAKAGLRVFFGSVAAFNGKSRPRDPRRILLVAGGYLGDSFWALQTVPLLKAAYPEAEIHVAGRPFLRVLANGIIPEQRVHEAAIVSDRTREQCDLRKLKRDARLLREAVRPDLAFDLMCNRYSAWFCHHLKTCSVGMDIAEEASPLYSFCAKRALIPSVHLMCRPRSIVNQFLGLPDPPDVRLIPPVPEKSGGDILAELGLDASERIVMLIPGAGWAAKRWSPENFRSLAGLLSERGFRIVLSGAPDEKDLCAGIADGVEGAKILCGSLSDTISLLPHCSAAVGNDSGVAHIAASFGIRTVELYCATNPDFSVTPGPQSFFIQASCPDSPRKDEQVCRGASGLTCDRPERMNCSVRRVLETILLP